MFPQYASFAAEEERINSKIFEKTGIAVSMFLSVIPLYGSALDDGFAGLPTVEEIPFEFELEPGDLPQSSSYLFASQ